MPGMAVNRVLYRLSVSWAKILYELWGSWRPGEETNIFGHSRKRASIITLVPTCCHYWILPLVKISKVFFKPRLFSLAAPDLHVWLHLLKFSCCLSKLESALSPLTFRTLEWSTEFIHNTCTEVPNATDLLGSFSECRLWSYSRVRYHLCDLLMPSGFLVSLHISGTWHGVWSRFWGHFTQPCPCLNQTINFLLDIVGMGWKSFYYPFCALWDHSWSELQDFLP